jgi:hypothetical protein
MPLLASAAMSLNTDVEEYDVTESISLQTAEGEAFEQGIYSMRVGIRARSRPDLLHKWKSVDAYEARPQVIQTSSYRVGQSIPVETTWVEVSAGIFPNSRNMTTDEREAFDHLSRADVRPLSKPLKRFKPR